MIRRTVVPDVIDPAGRSDGDAAAIGADQTVAEAARRMRALDVPALAVLAGDGTPLGLLGASDLIAALAGDGPGGVGPSGEGADPRHAPVTALMRPISDVLAPRDTMLDALELMCRRRTDCLPVLADGRCVGLVTAATLLAAVEAEVQALYLEMQEMIFGRAAIEPPLPPATPTRSE